MTVGFGITPNLLTLPRWEFPGGSFPMTKALAGLGDVTLTAGGDFHPALRTSAAQDEQPEGNYGESSAAQQAPWFPELACPHAARAKSAQKGP
jgi:hypothetical protein